MHVDLIDEGEQSAVAYAAREILGHPDCRARMTAEQVATLTWLIQQAGLGAGSIPEPLFDGLMRAVQTTGTVLARTVGVVSASKDQNRPDLHKL